MQVTLLDLAALPGNRGAFAETVVIELRLRRWVGVRVTWGREGRSWLSWGTKLHFTCRTKILIYADKSPAFVFAFLFSTASCISTHSPEKITLPPRQTETLGVIAIWLGLRKIAIFTQTTKRDAWKTLITFGSSLPILGYWGALPTTTKYSSYPWTMQ